MMPRVIAMVCVPVPEGARSIIIRCEACQKSVSLDAGQIFWCRCGLRWELEGWPGRLRVVCTGPAAKAPTTEPTKGTTNHG